ncbi:MAG TPA: exodeoxyribonuclease VII small subunit [Candidatus Prevotella intestinigallinarum]|nr:exodeoxyribonuclease VII small subunit [Candidatus Prevotella intestinigallinarum]
MKDDMKYEDAMRELERIVARMENEEPDIDSLGEQLRRAQQLIKLCKAKLTKTDKEIKDILESDRGKE